MLCYVPNHSKHRKTTKVIKLRWIASTWRQNDKKMLSYVPNHSKHSKTTKVIKLRWIASIWCQKHQTTQNYKSDQITRKCMDLTSKRTKMLSYVPNHSKQRKSTKFIKVQWIASIWCQNDQKCWVTSQTIPNTAKLQKWSNYDEVHGFDVKTNKNVELVANHSKQRKSTKVIKVQWIASIWCQNDKKCWVTFQTIRYSKTTKVIKLRWIASIWRQNDKKMLSYVPNHSKHSKTTKVIKLRWIGSIWRQNDQKCWVTSQTIPNTAKLQKWSNYDELDRFDVKTIKNVELRPKPFKTTQTYKSNQIAMNWIDLMSKTSNNAKLQKWSNYDEVHGLDVKTNKNVELRRKPFKTTQIYKGYQSTMNCIDLMSKTSNNAKLQKWSYYDELHRFDVKTIKNVVLRPKPFQTQKNYKSDQITMNCIDLTSKR